MYIFTPTLQSGGVFQHLSEVTSPVTKCLDKIQAPNRIKISVFIQKRKKSHVNVQEFTTNLNRDWWKAQKLQEGPVGLPSKGQWRAATAKSTLVCLFVWNPLGGRRRSGWWAASAMPHEIRVEGKDTDTGHQPLQITLQLDCATIAQGF